MKLHVKQQVITWQEFEIDVPYDTHLQGFLNDDPCLDNVDNDDITVMHEQEMVIRTELYSPEDKENLMVVWVNKEFDDFMKIIEPGGTVLTLDKLQRMEPNTKIRWKNKNYFTG